MMLVLCHASDVSALWAYARLAEREELCVELVTTELLACGLRWEHQLGRDGCHVRAELADGRVLDSRETRGVLNRVHEAPLLFWQKANAAEREYVQQELHAFYQSWLRCFTCPVLNPGSAQGLSGAYRDDAVWRQLAYRAGLPTTREPARSEAHRSTLEVIVAGEHVLCAVLSAQLRAACLELSRLARTPLMGVQFVESDGRLCFDSATAHPDLRRGGSALIEALVHTIGGERRAA